jgi:hypothetical protein
MDNLLKIGEGVLLPGKPAGEPQFPSNDRDDAILIHLWDLL